MILSKRAFVIVCLLASSMLHAQSTLPQPWRQQDIGAVGRGGSAIYADPAFVVRGGGADIWDNADAFHFVYRTLYGDGAIIVRVIGMRYTDAWAKAGVMLRETLDADSRHALMVVTPGNGSSFQRRRDTGGFSEHTTRGDGVRAPYWVKLVRAGNVFSGFKSSDGVNWELVGADTIAMSRTVSVGLAVTAHNNARLNTAAFDNVSVSGAVDPGSVNLYAAAADFSGSQDFRNWSYLDSHLAPLPRYDSANNRWAKPREPYLLIWSDGCHPGPTLGAVRRWTATMSGPINIAGNAHDLDAGGGDGVIAAIRQNGVEIWSRSIANGDAVGARFSLNVTVHVGDTIDFAVDAGANNWWDSTYFNPTIQYLAYVVALGVG